MYDGGKNGAGCAPYIYYIKCYIKIGACADCREGGMRISAQSERGLRVKKGAAEGKAEKEILRKNRLTNGNGYNIIPMFPKGKMRV